MKLKLQKYLTNILSILLKFSNIYRKGKGNFSENNLTEVEKKYKATLI